MKIEEGEGLKHDPRQEIDSMRHTESRITADDGLEVYEQVWAADQPRAHLVIVHGLGEHSGRYQNYVDYFVPRGCTLHGFICAGMADRAGSEATSIASRSTSAISIGGGRTSDRLIRRRRSLSWGTVSARSSR